MKRKIAIVSLLGLLLSLVVLTGLQANLDPILHAQNEYYRLALEIERAHPWADVISLGKEDTAIWCYVDVGVWYEDPGNPRYNIFALAQSVVDALTQIQDENTDYVFVGHMQWDPKEEKYAIRQPWILTRSTLAYYGALYPAVHTTWWVSGYLSPDSYRFIGNPYRVWYIRLLSYL